MFVWSGCLVVVNSGKLFFVELLYTKAGVPWQPLTAHLFKSHPDISLNSWHYENQRLADARKIFQEQLLILWSSIY